LNPQEAYAELVRLSRERTVLSSCAGLLQWDAEINMPSGGTTHRGEQLALLAGLAHDRATDPRIGDLLCALESSALMNDRDSAEAVNVRELRRDYDRETRLPRKLVEELARVAALSSQAWMTARENDDFESFAPWLEQTFSLAREKADAIGWEAERYDALLDDYEPGMTSAQLSTLFTSLVDDLVPLVNTLKERDPGHQPERNLPVDKQRLFSEGIAEKIGFDTEKGRFDLGPHPFCTQIGPGDVRIALRYRPGNFASGFLAVMHEMGHALYEQSLDEHSYGTPMGDAASLGIHESQSRLWENLVGRTDGFWRHFYPQFESAFGITDMSRAEFRASMNRAEPGLIRVEADEVTYNLHIVIRFEIERALLTGNLEAKDVPAAWNDMYQRYLGVTPPTDREGCLQDIHWSEGLIGYFPTYTLGNIYAAQLFKAADDAIGPLEESFARGEFGGLRAWLRENIHCHGRRYRPVVLVEKATGQSPDPAAMLSSLAHRYGLTGG
jgi:carboxypeptidase Taq